MQAKFRRCLTLLLTVGITASLSAQVICPADFPTSDSPVLSPSADDIPSTNDHILTYTGAHAAGRANHTISFIQTGPNEQKVWFFTDNASLDHEHVYYNRRYRADSSSPWYWQYSVSPAVLSYGAAADAVLYSPTPRYVDTRTSTAYKYVMYQIIQPPDCDPPSPNASMGYLYVGYSNDGICWTAKQLASDLAGPTAPCIGAFNTVPSEAVTAFDDGSGDVKLIIMKGDIEFLADADHMYDTHAVIAYAPPTSPSSIYFYESSGVSNTGIYSPTGLYPPCCFDPDHSSYSDRFTSYSYLMNTHAAYDPSTGDLYMGRAYAYPFDRGAKSAGDPLQGDGWVPQYWQGAEGYLFDSSLGRSVQVSGCHQGKLVLPNRIQLYRMHIGPLSNFAAVGNTSYPWILLTDLGNASGYSYTNSVSSGSTTPLTYWQTNAGRDYAAVSFLRDGQGNLVRKADGTATYFAGDTFELSKSSGPCQVTGLERETIFQVP